jgi:hypothetical protein
MRKYAHFGIRRSSCSQAARAATPTTSQKIRISIMEAERINLIGTKLADLSARTLELRGYL